MQRDGAVPLRAVGSLQGQAEKRLEAPGVAAALAVRDDGHRQHLGVGGEYFGRVVGRGIVEHQELILTREGRKDLPHFPEHQPGCAGFVMHRDTDVDHGPAI